MKRILLMDDSPIFLEVMRSALENEGYAVVCASNLAELDGVRSQVASDLVLMDVQMPELDGLAATRAWRELETRRGFQPVPIVALTANAMVSDEGACLAAGMTEFLPKPLEFARLRSLLVSVSERGARRSA